MQIKTYWLDSYKQIQYLTLESPPLSAANVADSLAIYAYAGHKYECFVEDYVFICLDADKEFDQSLLDGCQYLGTVVLGSGESIFGGPALRTNVKHIYYAKAALLEKVLERTPDENKFATAFENINYYLNNITKVHAPEAELEC